MKHLDESSTERLSTLLDEAGLHVPAGEQALLIAYLDEIIETNRSVNLTRITGADSAIRLHLVDSLLALPETIAAPSGRLLDMGTGGGLPGVPLCVASGRPGVLLDSIGKKVQAVKAAMASAGIESEIVAVAMRAEDLALSSGSSFSVVTARAVSSIASLVELASPLLKQGGRLVALKGQPDQEEMLQGERAGQSVGMAPLSSREVALPGGPERRTIVVYEKVAEPKIPLPRRVGQAQTSPLG